MPSPGYLKALRELCDQNDMLLMFDEVQTGVGRLGTLFGYQVEGVIPDVMTLAKGLGNGMPIGALVATENAAKALGPGTHGSTFGGGPLACAAALAVLNTIAEDPWTLENVKAMGDRLSQGLKHLMTRFPQITEVRGHGLLVGAQMATPSRELIDRCLQRGLLLSLVGGGSVVRFTPPLTVREADVDQALSIFSDALAET